MNCIDHAWAEGLILNLELNFAAFNLNDLMWDLECVAYRGQVEFLLFCLYQYVIK